MIGRNRSLRALAALLAASAAPAIARQAPIPGPAPAPVQAPTVTAAPAPAPPSAPAPYPAPLLTVPPGSAETAVVGPALPPDVQVVRFTAPTGARIEVLGPPPEPIAVTPASPGALTVGLKVGVGYRLKVTGMEAAPGAELYPVVELVGHLHYPPSVDPLKFPLRIPIGDEDAEDAAARGRMVMEVVYLEAPEQAIPVSLPKDEIPVVTLSPVESPLKVAPALGRPMAIVRMGGRAPTVDELSGAVDYVLNSRSCPFAGPDGGACNVPCGAVSCLPPRAARPWVPKDEFLCDGGDGGFPASFDANADLRGIEPRDAVVRFQADARPRVLPTNRVCIYAPRFAAVRATIGANQSKVVETLVQHELTQRETMMAVRQSPKRFTQNQAAELARYRSRASMARSRVYAGEAGEVRVLQGYDVPMHIGGYVDIRNVEIAKQRQQGNVFRVKLKGEGIKTAETAVVSGIAEGLGQNVIYWKPQEMAGVEVPPNKPGLMVLKQVNKAEAEPGDLVTYTIRYRNMGNVPIRSVSVLDSLLPRLEYIPQSALGPAGTVFAAGENAAGSMELRWDLPGALAPGQEGYVEFRARVR